MKFFYIFLPALLLIQFVLSAQTCAPFSIPYRENFDSITPPAYPSCITTEASSTGSNWQTGNYAIYYGTSGNMIYYFENTTTSDAWFFTPLINLSAGTSYRLSFKYGDGSNSSHQLEVRFGTAAGSSAMTNTIVSHAGMTAGITQISKTNFTPAVSGAYSLGFHSISQGGTHLYLDNIELIVTPTCDTVSQIYYTHTTTTSTQINWKPPVTGTPLLYQIYYSTVNTPPTVTTAPLDSVAANSYTAGNLSIATKYYLWLKTKCSNNDYGDWSAVDSFNTECLPVSVPYFQDFQSAIYPDLPPCTAVETPGPEISKWRVVNSSSGTQLLFNWQTLPSVRRKANSWFTLPGFNLMQGKLYRISFFGVNNNSPNDTAKLEVKFGDYRHSSAMTMPVAYFPHIDRLTHYYSADFTVPVTGVYYIGFHAVSDSTGSNLTLDNIKIEEAIVTPLNLLAFTAQKYGKVNLLQWSTTHEKNFNHFEIERSANGIEFSKSGTVKPKAQINNNYKFTDEAPLKQINYYRLKMIDKDGSYTYSSVRTVSNAGSFYVSVYPNPAKDKLQVQLVCEKRIDLRMHLLSQDGKVLLTNNWSLPEGSSIKNLDISSLQSGSYYLKISSGGQEQSVVKFEKM